MKEVLENMRYTWVSYQLLFKYYQLMRQSVHMEIEEVKRRSERIVKGSKKDKENGKE
jgi:hypothetical protein